MASLFDMSDLEIRKMITGLLEQRMKLSQILERCDVNVCYFIISDKEIMIKVKTYAVPPREVGGAAAAQLHRFAEFIILARLNEAGNLELVEVK